MNPESFSELCCNVCLELYGDGKKCPRILSCGHTFCLSCAKELIVQNSCCAICKANTRNQNAEHLPVNFGLKSLVETMKNQLTKRTKKEINPEIISDNWELLSEGQCIMHRIVNHFKCLDCLEYICGTCVALHHKSCRTVLVKAALMDMKNKEACQLEEVLKRRILDDKSIKNLTDIFTDAMTSLNREIKKSDTQLISKCREMDDLQKLFQNFVIQKRTRQQLWSSLECYYLPEREFYSEKDLQIIKAKVLSDIDNIYKQDLLVLPNKISTKMNKEILQKWLQSDMDIYAVQPNESEHLFGKIRFKNGMIRIDHLGTHKPDYDHVILLPFEQILKSLTKVDRLPKNVFLEICDGSDSLGEVRIETDGWSTRAVNFLTLCSGIKGPNYVGVELGNCKICFSSSRITCLKTRFANGSSWNGSAVIEGIKDNGVYRCQVRRGFIGGSSVDLVDVSSFHIITAGNGYMVGKFGELTSGLSILDNIHEKHLQKVRIKECGLILNDQISKS